jgi:uncharacterized damage-inducible protein DinB
MKAYRLYLESGPKLRKTLVHVLDLDVLGCVATGSTSDEAVAAAPAAIRSFLGFLQRHGEPADPAAEFRVEVAEHITEGQFLGSGSPSIAFQPDLQPLTDDEITRLLGRFGWLRTELAEWAERQAEDALDAETAKGRTNRKILLHVLGPTGGYLSAALGGAKGFSSLQGKAERGDISIAEALRAQVPLAHERVWEATPDQRRAVVQRPRDVRTLRKALRRVLEHDWEHLAELSRRPGGPAP